MADFNHPSQHRIHITDAVQLTSQINPLGYSIESGIFSHSECEHLLDAVSSSDGKRARAGARHLMNHPSVAAIALDQRLLGMARRWLGADALPYRATLFEKSIDAKWFVVWQNSVVTTRSRWWLNLFFRNDASYIA